MTTTATTRPTALGNVEAPGAMLTRKASAALAVLRVATGLVFLWAFMDKTFGLGYATVRTDASGNGPDGKPVELPVIRDAREPLLRAIFEAESGTAPRLKETEAGFVAVELREV